MLDTEPTSGPSDSDATSTTTTTTTARRRRAASRPAGPPVPSAGETAGADTRADAAPAAEASAARASAAQVQAQAPAPAKKATRRTAKKAAVPVAETPAEPADGLEAAADADEAPAPAKKAARKTAAKKTSRARKATAPAGPPAAADAPEGEPPAPATLEDEPAAPPSAGIAVLFQAPEATAAATRRRAAAAKAKAAAEPAADETAAEPTEDEQPDSDGEAGEAGESGTARRRRRGGRGRRGRGKAGDEGGEGEETAEPAEGDTTPAADGTEEAEGEGGSRRRRRRRRRSEGDDDDARPDDPPNTVVRVRQRRERSVDDEVRSVKGSVRLEAKKQRRRDGREQGRRRTTIITEAEFLARREAVHREMLVRQVGDRTQIAVLEDDVLVEHHVTSASASGLVGNVYLGKVQNVLPSMEAAFVDIGRGRNAVLYAGEVNWDAAGLEGQPKRIEVALKSGDSVLVQVTKDPIGHKGARLTSQVSLPGRFLVYVPGGSMTGISRKLPDTERTRLKAILKQVVPEEAGVIVRTAAEGASEEELSRDVARLKAQWEDIEKKGKTASAPSLLYAEPDLSIRVVRDIFNEDFASLVVSGDDAWETIEPYVKHVAPDLADRLSRWTEETDVFAGRRVDEQLLKALDRKVWLPSGGYLIIDRTEAMVVVDVNTGKFTGSGGDLEETVTRNNLEAAEEIVRQLRLRDLGGIIVVDFIDMVLESNRDLVLRRLLECLGRDRTKHQVAEVTSLGLVQMTRKRVGQGLFEVFSTTCECCNGRGVHVGLDPVEPKERDRGANGSNGNGNGGGKGGNGGGKGARAGRGGKGAGARSRGDDEGERTGPPAEPAEAGEDRPARKRGGRRARSRAGEGESAAEQPAGERAEAEATV